MRTIKTIAAILLVLIASYSCQNKTEVEMIITNAKVYTVNDSFEIVESIAISNGKFIAVGKESEILSKYSSHNIVDAKGKFVYPGFNDGHSHFLSYGLTTTKYADLVGTGSFEEVVDRVITHNEKYSGKWVLGRGWDQNDWNDITFPTNEKLDEAFPETPVALTRIDGHALIVNSEALRLAGITVNSKVLGGEFKMVGNRLTGVLIDNAMDMVRSIMPDFSKKEKVQALQKAQEDCFSVGLTSVTDAGLDKDEIHLIDKLQGMDSLSIRVYAMISPNPENLEFFFKKGPVKKDKLTVSAVKLYIDGALGSRGALLLEPYSDDHHTHGLRLNSQSYFDSICMMAYNSGYQVATHAIGDSGNRIMLQSYAKYLKGKNDKRWRIEHAQVVSPEDLKYFNEYSIVPSVQATHCTSDMYWADERLGPDRIKTAYAYSDLLDQNGWIVNGTDFPIEGISPLLTYYASVARKDLKNWPEGGFQKENALSREDALKSITIWPARGSFEESKKGSIEVGKVADLVILDQDIFEIPEDKIPTTKVISTYVDGKLVYGK